MFIKFLTPLLFLSLGHTSQPTPIVVTAKRHEFLKPQASVKSIIFTPGKIRKNQYSQITEVINATPGFTLIQSGGPGQQASIFARGTNSSHIQARLDGMRINSPEAANGTVDTSLMSTQSLNSITLIRGGQSSLYGADAVGGVILLMTPKGTGEFKETASIETGSQKTLNLYGNLRGGFKNSGAYLGLSRYSTNGFHQTPTEYRYPTGSYPKLPYRQGSYAARLDHTPNDYLSFSLISRLTSGNLSYQLPTRAISQHREQGLQRFIMTITPTPTWQNQLGFGYLSTEQVNERNTSNSIATKGQRQQFDWTQIIGLSMMGTLSIILESSKDIAKQTGNTTSFSPHQDTYGFAALWQNKWDCLGGDLSIRHDKISNFESATTHREGITFTPFKSTKILASHATSFKTPTLYQMYANSPYFHGNPLLKAETSHQYEAGFEQRLWQQFLWEETYFINHLNNLIDSSADRTSLTNIGQARTSGLESVLTWIGQCGWSADLNHTITKTRNLVTNQRLLRRPLTKLSGRINFEHNQWLWIFELTRLGHRLDVHPLTYKTIKAKPYLLINLKTQWQYSDSLRLFGRIENFLNKKIQDPVGYRKTGISVFIGLEKTIG